MFGTISGAVSTTLRLGYLRWWGQGPQKCDPWPQALWITQAMLSSNSGLPTGPWQQEDPPQQPGVRAGDEESNQDRAEHWAGAKEEDSQRRWPGTEWVSKAAPCPVPGQTWVGHRHHLVDRFAMLVPTALSRDPGRHCAQLHCMEQVEGKAL